MANHNTAFVPIETWAYASPVIRNEGSSIDIGLFAEALLYYDCIIVNPGDQLQFSKFLQWFINQNRLDDFYELLDDGYLKIYDYSFTTAAVQVNQDTSYVIANLKDPVQAVNNTFERRFLYHREIDSLFSKARHKKKLYSSLRDNVIEVKAEEISGAIDNANQDNTDPRRIALVVQAFVDEVYKYQKLGHPPKVEVKILPVPGSNKHTLTWNIDFTKLSQMAGNVVNFHESMPLKASAYSNRIIWSASNLNADLYLPSPMSTLVGDKLYESTQRMKAGKIIEDLKAEVEFPNIKNLVNSGKMNLEDLLKVRKKAKKFRTWLQNESERDRNAIIAYHHEVARESGIITSSRKALSIFGVLGGSAAGSAVGSLIAGPIGAAAGAATGGSLGYLADIASKVGADWRPVVFGDWFRQHIEDFTRD